MQKLKKKKRRRYYRVDKSNYMSDYCQYPYERLLFTFLKELHAPKKCHYYYKEINITIIYHI
jgi:hypothetical protein